MSPDLEAEMNAEIVISKKYSFDKERLQEVIT
jgi:hypothetical protein